MRKIIVFMVLMMCFLNGCAKKECFQEQLAMERVDVNAFPDFYCVVEFNNSEEDYVICDEAAKGLYTLLSEYADSARQIETVTELGDNYIHVSFERGDATNQDGVPMGGYYGSFLIDDKNEMYISASPAHSFNIKYKLGARGYDDIVNYIEQLYEE